MGMGDEWEGPLLWEVEDARERERTQRLRASDTSCIDGTASRLRIMTPVQLIKETTNLMALDLLHCLG